MIKDTKKSDYFYVYYKRWIQVYKDGAIRKVTMDKYLLAASWVEKLIPKDESIPEKLSKEEQEKLKPIIESEIDSKKYTVMLESLEETDQPMLITQNEFMRRYEEMSMMGGGGMSFYGEMPESYNLVVNINHPLIGEILNDTDTDHQKELVHQLTDLALLSNGLLKGEALTNFINRSVKIIK